jgi:hypothetical protein
VVALGGPQATTALESVKIVAAGSGARKGAIRAELLATKRFQATEASWRATYSSAKR